MHSEFDETNLRLKFWCIAKDWGHALGTLEIGFNASEGAALEGVVRMSQRNLDWTYRFNCCGYDLSEFRKQVLALHAERQIVAELTSLEGFFTLTLETIPTPERTLLISGQVESINPNFSWKIPFGGFRGDASYLPDLARNIASFLTVVNVSTEHPMVERP